MAYVIDGYVIEDYDESMSRLEEELKRFLQESEPASLLSSKTLLTALAEIYDGHRDPLGERIRDRLAWAEKEEH